MNYPANYLSFLNSLGFLVQFAEILEIKPHQDNHISGWQGLESLVCLDQKQELYDIDIRYAWDSEIFQQNLIDHGWSETSLLTPRIKNKVNRHKLIIYLCEDSTRIDVSQKLETVPERFIIGSYWQTVSHFYLLLPREHPFKIKSNQENTVSVNFDNKNDFLTTEKPTDRLEKSDRLETQFFLPPHPQRRGEGGLRTKGLYKTSRDKLPLISVITVVFNGEKYLEQTIQSVINSSYPNLEYIVIDGGSSDSSLDIIKKYEDCIDYWVSEPDKGIYDAMNKGTIAALGDYTLHINADDLLFDAQCLETIINEIQNENKEELSNLFSSILFYRVDKENLSKKEPKIPQQDPLLNVVKIPGGHQGFLGIRNKNSIFDSNKYRIVAERIVMSEKIKSEKIAISSTSLAICRSGGISYGINFAMLNEIRLAIAPSRNPQVFLTLLGEYLRLSLLWFVKITGLIKLKQKISR